MARSSSSEIIASVDIGTSKIVALIEEINGDNELKNIVETNHEKIMMMKNGKGYNWDHILEEVSKIVNTVKSYNTSEIITSLQNFIPEYSPDRNNIKL